jgi:predicted P-loop ATPase
VEQLVKLNKMKPNEAIEFVDKTYDREDLTVQSISKDPEKLIQNLAEWMKETHPIRKNTITGMIEEEGIEVKKERLSTIYLQARATFNTPNVTFELCNHIIFSEFTPEFNPITEYIENNRHRTSTGNILALVNCIQTDTKNYDVFIKKWLIGMIAAYNGNAVRYVLALVGGQMTGKTEFFRRLLPDGIKRYYAESKLDAGKDDDILMCQKLIVMDDEMGGKSKQDEKRLKELTSKSVFSLRAPYGRHNEDFKRLAILCGTSNDTEIINDPTGNTRIIPIQVNKIDFDAYNAIDKDELFMEIVTCFEDNHQWNLNKADFDILTETSENFETVSIERELLLQFFGVPQPDGFGEWLSTTEIKNHIELNSKQIIKGTKKLGIELKKIYGNIKSVKINGISLKKYKVVRLNQNNPTTFSTMQTFDIQENAF